MACQRPCEKIQPETSICTHDQVNKRLIIAALTCVLWSSAAVPVNVSATNSTFTSMSLITNWRCRHLEHLAVTRSRYLVNQSAGKSATSPGGNWRRLMETRMQSSCDEVDKYSTYLTGSRRSHSIQFQTSRIVGQPPPPPSTQQTSITSRTKHHIDWVSVMQSLLSHSVLRLSPQ